MADTTPAPGDLNPAGSREALAHGVFIREIHFDDGVEHYVSLADFGRVVTTLSALPAAGGWAALVKSWRERADKMLPTSGVDTHWHEGARDGMNQCASEAERLLPTTPQPSAVSFDPASIGPFTAAAALMQATDAAVGAQGEGEVAGEKEKVFALSNWLHDNRPEAERVLWAGDLVRIVRLIESAAPAAGKGVDGEAIETIKRIAAQLASEDCEGDAADLIDAMYALTRQPVAGDGIRNGYRHVVHELLTNIKRAAIRGRSGRLDDSNFIATCDHVENLADEALSYIAPAATPTDGGEG